VSLAPVTMHPLQPIIEEVTTPVQSLVKPTLPEESDAPSSHVINIPSLPPSEQERFILPRILSLQVLTRPPSIGTT
jgi:hypothetical protein